MRPTRLEEVLANEAITSVLQKKISEGNIPAALLFVGPPGTGKTTTALIVAQMLGSVDIRERNAADLNGVDDMRELVKDLVYRPLNGQFTVVILDEAQKLTEAAQNVLLKPVEEKDSPVVWIICTTDPGKLIPPLRKRFVPFVFKVLNSAQRLELIKRAFKFVGRTGVSKEFLAAIDQTQLFAPRDILVACERFLDGTPASEAVLEAGTEHDPVYRDVARAVLAGDWGKTAELLEGFRTSDARGLRGTVMAFLAGSLIKEGSGNRADSLSRAITDLNLCGLSFADGEIFSATKGALYQVCRRLGKE